MAEALTWENRITILKIINILKIHQAILFILQKSRWEKIQHLLKCKIDSIKITTSLRYTYNLKDVYTDNNGLLYFYLPEGTNITEVETEDAVYSGTITTNSIINKKRKLSNDYYDEYTIGTAFAVFNYRCQEQYEP